MCPLNSTSEDGRAHAPWLTPGKYADIIAVRGDVLRYINLLQDVDIVMRHDHLAHRAVAADVGGSSRHNLQRCSTYSDESK